MALKDRYGLEISTSSEKAANFYIQGIDTAIAANANAEQFLLKSIKEDEDFALPYAALAMLSDMWGHQELKNKYLHQAKNLVVNGTIREKNHVLIVDLILKNQQNDAFLRLKSHINSYPNDVYLLSQITGAYGILAFSGNPNFENERLLILENCKRFYHNDWWFDAMYAYSLTEVNKHTEALELAEKSLSLHYHCGHTAHTYAHILYETKKWNEAELFLQKWFVGYDESSPIAGHLRWHQALTELALNKPQKALEIYYNKIKPAVATSPNYGKGIDAAALLWRISLKNNSIEHHLWQEITSFFKSNFSNVGDPFLDVHKSFAFNASKNEIDLSNFDFNLAKYYLNNESTSSHVVLKINTLIKNTLDNNKNKSNFLDLISQLPCLGGSHAQRDIIIETLEC